MHAASVAGGRRTPVGGSETAVGRRRVRGERSGRRQCDDRYQKSDGVRHE